jgi:hypothetical protein
MRKSTIAIPLALGVALAVPSSAQAGGQSALRCDELTTKYTFTGVVTSTRPTGLKSAYITGPGTVSYNKATTTSVSASMTSSVSAEAGVVLAKASTTIGVGVTAGRSWSDGFTYSLPVPSGQRRAMQLFQASRYFKVTKYTLNATKCTYSTSYAGNIVNAPLTAREDEWKLVS